MHNNIMTQTDSYKQSHYKQYPPNTEFVHSYLESRIAYAEVIPFGFQANLIEYLAGPVVTREKIREAALRCRNHFGQELFNYAGWNHILYEHHGYLPVKIMAVPEGKPTPGRFPLLTIQNTDPKCWWLTNFLETLLVQAWYPISVATQSREIKKIIHYYLELTGDLEGLPYKLHDFGFRGVSSVESARIGGAAHLINFKGTDTMPALDYIWDYYQGKGDEGQSIPAAEHSTITSWGRDGEGAAFANMLEQYPTGLVAVVSDSYDIEYACKVLWGSKLKNRVLKRDGILVVRPDSGEPVESVLSTLNYLGDAFGFRKNKRGFCELPPQLRIIQGDGVNKDSIAAILEALKFENWSANNIAFGMGGALLQKLNRDDYSIVMKCCEIKRASSEWEDVYKQPKGDPLKASSPGSKIREQEKQLRVIFEDGYIKNLTNFAQVQERAVL
jgi:nicotinamide phosphoribosyltransferase